MMNVTQVLAVANAGGGFTGWVGLSGLALMTSLLLLAFAYIWSVLFRNQQMTGMVKIELYEVFVSALIVVFLFGIIGAMQTLKVSALYPASILPPCGGVLDKYCLTPDMSFYQATENYFLKVKDEMLGWIDVGYTFGIYVDLLATITPYTRPLSVGFVSTPFAGLGAPIKQLLNHAMMGVVVAYVINYAQYFTFLFAIDAFLKYYLPAGVFLRCFTPTRRIGGSIIAVTASFLIVLPILCTTTYVIFYSPGSSMLTFADFVESVPVQLKTFGSSFTDWLFKGDFTFWEAVFLPFFAMVKIIEMVVGTVFFLAIGFAAGIIGRAFLIGYIMPTFNILVLTQSAKSLSKAIGEEIDISSLTRLI